MEITYKLRYENRVLKDLMKLDNFYKTRIHHAIHERLLNDPLKYGKPLQYSPMGLRAIRIGKFRVLFFIEIDTSTLVIYKVGHRGKVYRNIFNQ